MNLLKWTLIALMALYQGISTLSADASVSGRDPRDVFLPSGVKSTIDEDKIFKGGPRIDGIPSIDRPRFLSAKAAKYLRDDDLILGLEIGGVARAYPIRILNWHEIVNDQVGEMPVVISYCPLCGSGMAFDRRIKDKTHTFGVSGLLYNSDVLMYDRETRSLWSQILGESVVGMNAGMKLDQVPLHYARWGDWKKSRPHTLVLSNRTGHFRNYDRDPYGGYRSSEKIYFPVDSDDPRLKRKELVYGIRIGDRQKAYPLETVRRLKRIEDALGKEKVIVEYKGGAAVSSLESGKEVPGTVAFWFAWSSFFPSTEVYLQ